MADGTACEGFTLQHAFENPKPYTPTFGRWDSVKDEGDQKLTKAINKMKRGSSQVEDGSFKQGQSENASSHGKEADPPKENGPNMHVEESVSEKEKIVNGEGHNLMKDPPPPETPLHFGWKDRQIAQSSSTAKKPDGVFAKHLSGSEGSFRHIVDAAAGENRGGSKLKRREGSGVSSDPSMNAKATSGDVGELEKRMSALEDGQKALLQGQDRMTETLSSILSVSMPCPSRHSHVRNKVDKHQNVHLGSNHDKHLVHRGNNTAYDSCFVPVELRVSEW